MTSERRETIDDQRWVHPALTNLSIDRWGPFLALADGRLMTVDDAGMRISQDEGATWSAATPVCPGVPPPDGEPASHYLVQTRTGTMVMVYLNFSQWKFDWDSDLREPKPGCCGEIWAVRSHDGGKTWTDRQRILDGYNANFFGFIRTSTGRLVASVEHLVANPGRWVACSLYSDDEGGSWKRSHPIDLGGNGHHDGATEPAVVELADGRLLMLIRTTLGHFWQAFSEDHGRTWRTIQPSALDASSAPGALVKLHSGRLVLVWNRAAPADGGRPLGKPFEADRQYSEFPASWYREELSVAISDDDARTWSTPVVLARQPGQVSYPYVFERRPGEIWITAGFIWLGEWGGAKAAPFRVKLTEQALETLCRG